ncbi:uncharacterized protein LOC111861227 [Cryptotermes secundus]|uniref:uncharacterized protein LOC111861227 n=1 Tax=Cryptotermes secundus TaxID=105785 RepID=UPI000CD7C978|nr:uncharacterized protein LOC111861227 [Cryptotermes secundus]
MLVLLVLVIASPNYVSGVMSRQNMTSNDVTIGRNTISPHYAYIYYDGHSSPSDTNSPYYSPGTHYHQYEAPEYQQGHAAGLCTWHSSFMDYILQIGAAKMGLLALLKAVITAVGATVLTKLPLILFKLIALPFGVIILALPLLLPILAMFIPVPVISLNGHDPEECTSDCVPSRRLQEKVSKALRTLLDSEGCVERLACELGSVNSGPQYKKPISWLLAYMQRSAPESKQASLAAYRTAYLRGSAGERCLYPCDVAVLVSAMFET